MTLTLAYLALAVAGFAGALATFVGAMRRFRLRELGIEDGGDNS